MNQKVSLVKIDTRTRREAWYRVDINDTPAGLVTKFWNYGGDINPWKAFLGIGNTTFLGVVYGDKQIAVDAVVAAFNGVDVSGDKFEKTHGIDAVIPAWKAGVL